MTEHSITITTPKGTDVEIIADSGRLFVTLSIGPLNIEREKATLRFDQGRLELGVHKIQGREQHIDVPITGHVDEIQDLLEASKPTDEPLILTLTPLPKPGLLHPVRVLSPSKTGAEMTDGEKRIVNGFDVEQIPEDAEFGDEFSIEDLEALSDAESEPAESVEERAILEAAESGERVEIGTHAVDCNGSVHECSLDLITRFALPDGEIETERVHTY